MSAAWIAAAPRPKPLDDVRVERHPAFASADPARRYAPLAAPVRAHALGESFQLDRLPYLLAYVGDQAVGAVSLALHGDDLVLLGFGGQPELGAVGLCSALLAEAQQVGREIGRRRLVAPLTNADPLPFFFLQAEGFCLAEVLPYSGPGRRGPGDIAVTHELVLERPIG